jgi:hypothetical protein
MSFQLEIQFCGLCLYVKDETNGLVGVVMPDARGRTTGSLTHPDGDAARRHVGYLRFDLGDVVGSFPRGSGNDPRFEVVRRFDFHEISIEGGPDTWTSAPSIGLPDFDRIAPGTGDVPQLRPVPGLFSSTPPSNVLMRMLLVGGELTGPPVQSWKLDDTLSPGEPEYVDEFASYVTWTGTVEGSSVTLHLDRIDGTDTQSITLAPAATDGSGVVSLKIANLCDKNPLEWDDLEIRTVTQSDDDFKWMYHLLEPVTGTYGDVLGTAELPIPRLPEVSNVGMEDCMGGQIKGDLP